MHQRSYSLMNQMMFSQFTYTYVMHLDPCEKKSRGAVSQFTYTYVMHPDARQHNSPSGLSQFTYTYVMHQLRLLPEGNARNLSIHLYICNASANLDKILTTYLCELYILLTRCNGYCLMQFLR